MNYTQAEREQLVSNGKKVVMYLPVVFMQGIDEEAHNFDGEDHEWYVNSYDRPEVAEVKVFSKERKTSRQKTLK